MVLLEQVAVTARVMPTASAQPERLLRGFGGGPWSWDQGMSMWIWFVGCTWGSPGQRRAGGAPCADCCEGAIVMCVRGALDIDFMGLLSLAGLALPK